MNYADSSASLNVQVVHGKTLKFTGCESCEKKNLSLLCTCSYNINGINNTDETQSCGEYIGCHDNISSDV